MTGVGGPPGTPGQVRGGEDCVTLILHTRSLA